MTAQTRQDMGKIVTLWMQTGRLLRDRIFHAHKKSHVNHQQIFAMFIIQEHEGLTMKELAEHLCITSPSATSIVNRLVRTKWVTRFADPDNRKLVRLKIGPAGRIVLAAVMKKQKSAMNDVLSLLNAKDRADFSRILNNLHDALISDTKRS